MPDVDPAIDAAVDTALAATEIEVVEIALPGWDAAGAAGWAIMFHEYWVVDHHLYERDPGRLGADIVERMQQGRNVIFNELKAKAGLLLCLPELASFYVQYGWQPAACPVTFDQPQGKSTWPHVALLLAPDGGLLQPAAIDLRGVRTQFVRWDPQREIEHLHSFDIGIMPLRMDEEWAIYKCGFKLIQYMAVGTPAVASPVGVNAEIVRPGENGFLATTPAEWEEYLGRHLEDSQLRQRLGAAARRRIEEAYSVQVHLPRLMETLENACKLTLRHEA
jgi:glycosyltransferase involved in cell wall biosynthesis